MEQNRIDDLVAYLEEHEISEEVINSIVAMASEKKTYPQSVDNSLRDDIIRMQLVNEQDWRKRAALVIQLIKKDYE